MNIFQIAWYLLLETLKHIDNGEFFIRQPKFKQAFSLFNFFPQGNTCSIMINYK